MPFGRAISAIALSIFAIIFSARSQEMVPVPQGWSSGEVTTWYTLSQGSRLIPLSWLLALRQPGNDPNASAFLDPAYIASFGYLTEGPSVQGVRLPVGFAVDTQNDTALKITQLRWKSAQSNREPWVGMNCSACHTGELTFQGKRFRIEGAPTLADFQSFMRALNRALVDTRDNKGNRFDGFAAAVLKGADTSQNRNRLKGALNALTDWQLKLEKANDTSLAYGFARLDAFGNIFNKVLLRAENGQNGNSSDAPVSYPFLWNIHQQDKVQWNGIAPNLPLTPNLDIGALGRNVGEVIGVFADLEIRRFGPAIDGYSSSVRIGNLIQLEQQVARLLPPAWPDAFPPIDANKWERGKAIFEREDSCAACHLPLKRDDLKSKITVEMTKLIGPKKIGTDPWMACNAYTYGGSTGLLELTPKKFFLFPPSAPYGTTATAADMLGTEVTGTLWNKRDDIVETILQSKLDVRQSRRDLENAIKDKINSLDLFSLKSGSALVPGALSSAAIDNSKDARLNRCMTEHSPVLAYKGRPLTGVWATPPFLHNGSVPTLFDLLLAPKDRPQSFALGTREFDPEKVGYVTNESKFTCDKTKAENRFVFNTRDAAGPIAGNSNDGHDYGNAQFTDDDRWALVEYMKAVGGRREGSKIVP